MDLTLAYRDRSVVAPTAAGLAIALAPNLRRDRVAFDATLRHPLRFREAAAALHEVVVGDFRARRLGRDRSAHQAHLRSTAAREAALRAGARDRILAEPAAPIDPEDLRRLDADHARQFRRYWAARARYEQSLVPLHERIWRALMPLDPIITVAPDVVFFEGFAADESSYAALTIDREGFEGERDVALGTTNVDYSRALADQFQLLRSYRSTRFAIDPAGFEVATEGQGGGYREERVTLPPGWLRGFLRLQSAMSLPARRVALSREGLYNVLAFLDRHRAARTPRAIRFELEPGRPVALVLEPWEERIVLHDRPYDGPRAESIRVWGRDRLRPLARLLPLMDGAEVHLLGTGLPSFWSVRLGEIRFLLGLSGWTANNWTGGSALERLGPPVEAGRYLLNRVAAGFRESPAQTASGLASKLGATPAEVVACLNQLAGLGQVIHDLPAGLYRWRAVMPVTIGAELLGPEDPETVAAREIAPTPAVRVARDEVRPDGLRKVEGEVLERPASLVLDADGRMIRGRCTCSHHFKSGLRAGPCRHLQALRAAADAGPRPAGLADWLGSFAG